MFRTAHYVVPKVVLCTVCDDKVNVVSWIYRRTRIAEIWGKDEETASGVKGVRCVFANVADRPKLNNLRPSV